MNGRGIGTARTWYWNSQRIGGGDVLEFVMKYENKTYAEALEVVLNPTQSQSDRPQFKAAPPTEYKSEKQELILPPRAKGQFKRAFAYLTISRCIAPDIVTTLCLSHDFPLYRAGHCDDPNAQAVHL